MTNIRQKAEEMIQDEKTFCQSTDHRSRMFENNYQRFLFYRTNEITALDILYRRLVMDEKQYIKSLTPEEYQKVFNEKLSLQRDVELHPSLIGQLEEKLAYTRIVSLFDDEKAPAHWDYLLHETAFVIVLDLDKIEGSAIQQFPGDPARAEEIIEEIFEQMKNEVKVDSLVWCYNKMAKRIKQTKGWK